MISGWWKDVDGSGLPPRTLRSREGIPHTVVIDSIRDELDPDYRYQHRIYARTSVSVMTFSFDLSGSIELVAVQLRIRTSNQQNIL